MNTKLYPGSNREATLIDVNVRKQAQSFHAFIEKKREKTQKAKKKGTGDKVVMAHSSPSPRFPTYVTDTSNLRLLPLIDIYFLSFFFFTSLSLLVDDDKGKSALKICSFIIRTKSVKSIIKICFYVLFPGIM